jgi:hypothetical protein
MTRNPSAGLTQLELLVSLALMSLMAVLAIAGMDFVQRATRSGTIFSATTDRFLVQEQVRDWVAKIPSQNSALKKQMLFSGDDHSLQFSTILNDGIFWPGALVKIDVALSSEQQEFPDLVLIARGISEANRNPIEIRNVLFQSPVKFEISYYGSVQDQPAAWHGSWNATTVPPLLVKIEWDTAAGAPVPPLTLKPAWQDRQSFKSLSSLVPPG